jgi:hypothetical protein
MLLFVAESEAGVYREYYPNLEIITHPKLSSLSLIRQAIYERFGDVFMVDDDIVGVYPLYDSLPALSPVRVAELINKTYQRAVAVGASLFVFNNDPVIAHYNQHKPFMFTGYVNGCAFGLVKDKNLYFHSQTVACESHWINLLNAYYNRFLFIDKRFNFRQEAGSTFVKPGGQVGRRTLESEKQDTLFLKKMFGDSVVVKKAQNKTKQLHAYQRRLNIKL